MEEDKTLGIVRAVGGRKVFAGIISALVVLGNEYFQLGLNPTELMLALANLSIFVVSEGTADALERFATSKHMDKIVKIADSLIDDADEEEDSE